MLLLKMSHLTLILVQRYVENLIQANNNRANFIIKKCSASPRCGGEDDA